MTYVLVNIESINWNIIMLYFHSLFYYRIQTKLVSWLVYSAITTYPFCKYKGLHIKSRHYNVWLSSNIFIKAILKQMTLILLCFTFNKINNTFAVYNIDLV